MLLLKLDHLLRRVLDGLERVLSCLLVRGTLRRRCARWPAGTIVRAIGAKMHRLVSKCLGAVGVAARIGATELEDVGVMIFRSHHLRHCWKAVVGSRAVTVRVSTIIATAGSCTNSLGGGGAAASSSLGVTSSATRIVGGVEMRSQRVAPTTRRVGDGMDDVVVVA